MNPNIDTPAQGTPLDRGTDGRQEDAASMYLRAAKVLQDSGLFQDARRCYEAALICESDATTARVELASVLLKLGKTREAYRHLEIALSQDSTLASAHVLMSRACHLVGDAERGLAEFAWLTHPNSVAWRKFARPLWDGTPGRVHETLLLWTRPNSGLGDAIQFLRYVPLVKARGIDVVLECRPELMRLAQGIDGITATVAQGDALPSFDAHAPLPRLPVVLRDVSWPYTGSIPYLRVDAMRAARWEREFGVDERLKVGIVWACEPRRWDSAIRSARAQAFASLGSVEHVRLISLQVGAAEAELAQLSRELPVTRCIDPSTDLEDTAALVSTLDLVITVDTMVAHLAGALGRPVWTLLPFAADWRWMQGERTPWYPTMRLFRQSSAGNWTEVIGRVKTGLVDLRRPQ